jgi:hypothetical protein
VLGDRAVRRRRPVAESKRYFSSLPSGSVEPLASNVTFSGAAPSVAVVSTRGVGFASPDA